MGQIEIYEFLKTQRLTGNNQFFSANEIYSLMTEQSLLDCHKNKLFMALIQLERYGYVDVKMNGKYRDWQRLYRLKPKYCERPKVDLIH